MTPIEEKGISYFFIVFEESQKHVALPKGKTTSTEVLKDKRIMELEAELISMREDMRAIFEEQEEVNEQLQSAHEEVVSSNEELQSINEELETSKEEIESTNEELMTMNAEMQIRNDQLSEAYDYADAVLMTLRESILVLDRDARIQSANKTFYKTFEAKEEYTVGLQIYDLGNGQWELPQLRLLLSEIISKRSQFENYEVEIDVPKIGKKIMVLNGRSFIQKFSKQELILLAIEDVTEHTLAQRLIAEREEWIRHIANTAPVMMWTSDVEGHRNFFNATWLSFTGKKLEDEVGNQWHETINPVDREDYLKEYYNAVKKETAFQAEYRLLRADGEFRWVLSTAKPNFDAEGNYQGLIGTITEIHDQLMLNRELEKRVAERTAMLHELNIDLERSNNELQQFAFISSHDLQEPLRKISTYGSLLQKKYIQELPAQGQEYAEKISESARRMSQLIEDLLNFSRVSRNEQMFEMVDLNSLMMECMSDFELLKKEKKAVVKWIDLPIIQAAPIQMNQLFHNLLSNSFKFADQQRPLRIHVCARQLTEDEVHQYPALKSKTDYTEIIFQDNGIGFEQKFADQIFEIFQRLHDKNSYPGTGIGLALCKKIVMNHGGFLSVKSVVGEGTTFYIILPVAAM